MPANEEPLRTPEDSAWRLSNSLDGSFCVEALEGGPPEIFNMVQGAQFTSERFRNRLQRIPDFVALAILFSCSTISGCAPTPPQLKSPRGPTDDSTAQVRPPRLSLPDIAEFEGQRSDQFLVDIEFLSGGHPFLGKRSPRPHTGAHLHWENTDNRWPRGGGEPENYPPIYAVADGYIERVVKSFKVGQNDRYGVYLAFAQSGGQPMLFEYSIEPMVPESSPDFYRRFLRVEERQAVRKGEVIAYMYLPPNGRGCHIHFEILSHNAQAFTAPAIFTPDVVQAFAQRWRELWGADDQPIPACMGYLLSAGESPYDGNPIDVLR